MRKLLYALAAVAAVAPLAVFGTASAAPAHPAAPAAHAIPFNLPATKCWQITDADRGNYGSLWFDTSNPLITAIAKTSHSNHTPWCPFGPMVDGSQIISDPTNGNYLLAFHDNGNYVREYAPGQSGPCDVTNVPAGLTANSFCEWTESYDPSTGWWTIKNNYNNEYLTSTGSDAAVQLGGSGDTHWLITCLRFCKP
jgi:hypothetical protein